MEKVLKADVVPLKWSEMKEFDYSSLSPSLLPDTIDIISAVVNVEGKTPSDMIVGPDTVVIEGDTISVPRGKVLLVY